MKVYQHVDELNDRDGIGNDIQGFHSIFKKLGFESSVITRINNSNSKITCHSPFSLPKIYSDSIHIFHFGGTGYPIEIFQSLQGKKILRFHNMTPISFFKKFMDADLYKVFEKNETKSFLELYSLSSSVSYTLHDSLFNQSEFFSIVGSERKSYSKVFPIIRNYYQTSKNEKFPSYKIGFVGRWAPNKKMEDLLFTLYFLKKIHHKYQLILIGKKNSVFSLYNHKIEDLIQELNISDSVIIYENLSDEELKRELSTLDLYISMSEHEGFGIPILEAMAVGIPVLAFASSAVIETVRDAGLLFTKKEFPLVAELIHKIVSTPSLKTALLKSQSARLQTYNQFPYQEELLQIFQQI